jgi:hypothetical protein
MPTLWCDCCAFCGHLRGDVMKDGAGYCVSCKHAIYLRFAPPSDEPDDCDNIYSEAWNLWEQKFGPEVMDLVGISVECPLWEPADPERFPEPMSYCERHKIWYGTAYGCPRCKAEELVKEKGGVIL